jgi:hypothetical protein
MNVTLFFSVFVCIATNALIHRQMDHPMSILSETCLNGDEGREVHWPARAWSIITLVIFQVQLAEHLF